MPRSTSCGCTGVSAVASGSTAATFSRAAFPAPAEAEVLPSAGAVVLASAGATTGGTSAMAGGGTTASITAGLDGKVTSFDGWEEASTCLDGRERRGRRASGVSSLARPAEA